MRTVLAALAVSLLLLTPAALATDAPPQPGAPSLPAAPPARVCSGVPDCRAYFDEAMRFASAATAVAIVYAANATTGALDYGFRVASHVLVCHAVGPLQGASCVESVAGAYYVEQRGATGLHVYQETNGCPGLQRGATPECVQPDAVVL